MVEKSLFAILKPRARFNPISLGRNPAQTRQSAPETIGFKGITAAGTAPGAECPGQTTRAAANDGR
jgi:hypothetical protein